jgi:RNA polymerase sigma-70 factor (ECF subfamily)
VADADERQLGQAAAAGEAAAFATLVERWAPRLHRWLVATGTPHHDAEDVVQESFLRAHGALARYDSRHAFSTWLFTIAHRRRCEVAQRRRHAPLADIHAAPAAAALPEPLPAGGLWARARAALADDDYQLLWLHYAEERTAGELATILGCNGVAVRVRLHRARRRLERSLRHDPLSTVLEAQ